MVTNASLTHYHKTLDETTRLEKWIRDNYDNVWFFGVFSEPNLKFLHNFFLLIIFSLHNSNNANHE